MLGALRLPGDSPVALDGVARTLREWLAREREITRLTRPFLTLHAQKSGSDELSAVLEPGNEDRLRHTLKDLQLIDVLNAYPAEWEAEAFVAALRPLAPRLYSIASSQDAVGDEVHVTVAVVDYENEGERRVGAASAHLASLTGDEATARVFIEQNERFRLPADPSRDVIMIGPGTGVAPVSAASCSSAKRRARPGRNWLVFGARHFDSEFLYQVEWQDAARKGLLHRVDLAFSRDQHAAGLRAGPTARSGHGPVSRGSRAARTSTSAATPSTWRRTCTRHSSRSSQTHGGLERDGAESYLARLADDRRYLRDVY